MTKKGNREKQREAYVQAFLSAEYELRTTDLKVHGGWLLVVRGWSIADSGTEMGVASFFSPSAPLSNNKVSNLHTAHEDCTAEGMTRRTKWELGRSFFGGVEES